MGTHCGNCGKETLVGKPDKHGIWHYRCPYCVEHQDPKGPDPCPRCGCTAHEQICGSVPFNFTQRQIDELINNPFKPDVIEFACLNCSFRWGTPEFEKYLLTKVVKSVLPTNEFSEKYEVGK